MNFLPDTPRISVVISTRNRGQPVVDAAAFVREQLLRILTCCETASLHLHWVGKCDVPILEEQVIN